MVTLRLRRKEASDAHGYRTRDELRDTAEHDEPRLAEGRQPRGEREGYREAVREADDALGARVDRLALVRVG